MTHINEYSPLGAIQRATSGALCAVVLMTALSALPSGLGYCQDAALTAEMTRAIEDASVRAWSPVVGEYALVPVAKFGLPIKDETGRPADVDVFPELTSLAISGDGAVLYAGGDNQRIFASSAVNGEVESLAPQFLRGKLTYGLTGFFTPAVTTDGLGRQTPFEMNDWVRGLTFLLKAEGGTISKSSTLAALSQKGQLALLETNGENVSVASVSNAGSETHQGARALTCSPNGKYIAVASADSFVSVYATSDLSRSFRQWPTPGRNTTAISFSPDGTLLAAGGRNGVARIWDTGSGGIVRDFKLSDADSQGQLRRVRAVAFSPDGTLLAVAGDANQIVVWDLATGSQKAATVLPQRGKVFSLAFATNGAILFGDSRNRLNVWEIGSDPVVIDIPVHTGTVSTIQAVADPLATGSGLESVVVFTGSFDTTVVKWRFKKASQGK